MQIFAWPQKNPFHRRVPEGRLNLPARFTILLQRKLLTSLMRCIREALQAERQRKNFLKYRFFIDFYWFFRWKIWKNQNFQKFQFCHFFRKFFTTFVLIFNLEKIYRPTIPAGWDIFRTELYPEMDSNSNLNGWTIL